MKFNVEKFKAIARPMTQDEQGEIETREENRDWLALSAKFALLVRHILRIEKITQTELASRMGVSCAQVTKLLSGQENIGLQTIAKVEKALNRSLVSFREHNESSVFEPRQQPATQIFSFPVFYARTEHFSVKDHIPETFSVLATDKILV